MTDRNSQLQQIIEQNPGIQFRELMRSSGLKNGVLSHYVRKLEKNGAIKVVRGPRQARFFPPKITEEESVVIKALRRDTPRALLLALIKDDDGLAFSQLVTKVRRSSSTVSLYLSQIIEDGLVEVRVVEMKKLYYIKVRGLIDKLIEEYNPSLLERSASGFEDIVNSL